MLSLFLWSRLWHPSVQSFFWHFFWQYFAASHPEQRFWLTAIQPEHPKDLPLHAISWDLSSPQPQHTLSMSSVTQGMAIPSSVLIQCLMSWSYTRLELPRSLVLRAEAQFFLMFRSDLQAVSKIFTADSSFPCSFICRDVVVKTSLPRWSCLKRIFSI